jgi:dTDP-4-dehydrorhamnose 3,5-epimerase
LTRRSVSTGNDPFINAVKRDGASKEIFMNIRVSTTSITGIIVIEPEAFQDHRGFFYESYNKAKFAENGLLHSFVQDNHSRSSRGVLRGLHYQDGSAPQFRLIRCTVGEVWDVAVDLRVGSPTFAKWYGTALSAENKKQLLIAPEFAHGFVVLSDVAEVQYKCTGYHNASAEASIAWDDPVLQIAWPVQDPVLSDRDRTRGTSIRQYLQRPAFTYLPADLPVSHQGMNADGHVSAGSPSTLVR